MVTAADIKWGSYRNFEGPFYPGKHALKVVKPVSDAEKYLAVITATEGGRFDAVNMYDRMILSVGLIQWAEAGIFGASALLGHVKETFPEDMSTFEEFCRKRHLVELRKLDVAGPNKWRFVECYTGNVIDTLEEQRALFLHESDGTVGSWTDKSKEVAKEWAAAVATVFENERARSAQIDFTVSRLLGFVTPDVMSFLFTGPPKNVWHNVARAAYLSFAANLPAVAAKHFRRYLNNYSGEAPSYTEGWVEGLLRELTFGPGILIYPGRYNAIRPELERLFGVDLPDFAKELENMQEAEAVPIPDTKAVQCMLILLGYDLGPAHNDGIFGPKTKKAVSDFQRRNELKVDGIVGPRTWAVMVSQTMGRS